MKNPFNRQKSFGQKLSGAIKLPKHETKQDKYLRYLQQTFLYVAIFLAGYIVATVQFLYNF